MPMFYLYFAPSKLLHKKLKQVSGIPKYLFRLTQIYSKLPKGTNQTANKKIQKLHAEKCEIKLKDKSGGDLP